MRYVGGKSRLAKRLVGAILENSPERTGRVFDPFVGGGAVSSELAKHFTEVRISDTHPDLMMMWGELLAGWEPPSEVTEQEYQELRTADPSALRGFVGFGGSFGAKWFGGFARGSGRNYLAETKRNLLKIVSNFSKVDVSAREQGYDSIRPVRGDVVYCDPPYKDTLGYKGSGTFDHEEFYRTVEAWVGEGVIVFVSEYQAPAHWEVVLEVPHRVSVSAVENRRATVEFLYKVKAGH